MSLNIKICLDVEGKTLALLRLSVPSPIEDEQIENILNGKTETTKESYLECKNLLISTLKSTVNPRILRDTERRKADLRSKAKSLMNSDPAYAARCLREASEVQFPYEEVEELLNELEFALHLLNKDAYLIFDHVKSKKKKGQQLNGVLQGNSIPSSYGIPIQFSQNMAVTTTEAAGISNNSNVLVESIPPSPNYFAQEISDLMANSPVPIEEEDEEIEPAAF